MAVALCSEKCPASGECFTTGATRAARITFATFPGRTGECMPEAFLENREQVMGHEKDIYIPNDALDHVRYRVKLALGLDYPKSSFGIVPNGK